MPSLSLLIGACTFICLIGKSASAAWSPSACTCPGIRTTPGAGPLTRWAYRGIQRALWSRCAGVCLCTGMCVCMHRAVPDPCLVTLWGTLSGTLLSVLVSVPPVLHPGCQGDQERQAVNGGDAGLLCAGDTVTSYDLTACFPPSALAVVAMLGCLMFSYSVLSDDLPTCFPRPALHSPPLPPPLVPSQAAVTREGPVQNLLDFVADPGHNNILKYL